MADKKQSQFTEAGDFTDADQVDILKPTGGNPAWENFRLTAPKLWTWILGKSDTADTLNSAAVLGDTNEILVRQGTTELFRAPLGTRLATWIRANILLWRPTPVYLSSSTTLSAATHNNRIIICSAALTLTVPIADQEGFSCLVKNNSGGDVTFSGHFHPDNHTKLATGRRGTLFGYMISTTPRVELVGETST